MRKISYFLAVALGIFLLLSLIGVSQIWDGWTDEFSKNYEYASEQSAVFGKGNLVDVPPYVDLYKADKSFVLVRQNPHYYIDSMYDYNEGYEYKNGMHVNYFWIINLKSDCVYGPLDFDEFNLQCKLQNVDINLYRKFIESCNENKK